MTRLLRIRRLVEYVGEPEAVLVQMERSLRPGNFDTPRSAPQVRITVSQLGPAEFVDGEGVLVVAADAEAASLPKCNNHKLDTDERVCFYEQDFYVLSNFSAFTLRWKGTRFDTSEAAYHWEKFPHAASVRLAIEEAPSAHEAFKIAERHKAQRRGDWDDIKVDVMRQILRAKVEQHEYVRRKLLATGDRVLIEDSWRDSFWGWGADHRGQNMLGKLWMEIRAELRSVEASA